MATEKRLIDANALNDAIEVTDWYHISPKGYLQKGANSQIHTPLFKTDDIFQALKDAPTVDAVEVVRCKDCKWYKEGKLLAPNKFCFRLKHPTENRSVGYNFCEDDFCSYGERKDNVSITD